MRFKDKVGVVTGGASGIGRAIAMEFAGEGSAVFILDITEGKAGEVVQEIAARGGEAAALKVDATREPEIKTAMEQIIAERGRIDILVNNIGGSESIPFLEANEALWRKVLDTNLMTTILMSHAVLPHMVKQQYGRVVNIASIAGRQSRPFGLAYGAAKAGGNFSNQIYGGGDGSTQYSSQLHRSRDDRYGGAVQAPAGSVGRRAAPGSPGQGRAAGRSSPGGTLSRLR